MTAAIVRLGSGDLPDFSNLVALARDEGYLFLTRAEAEWIDGSNRFDKPGEGLFLARIGSESVGIAGLNVDPFLEDPTVGRLRRVYVAPEVRGAGIGGDLVRACIGSAASHFSRVRLRAENPDAARLYERLGFVAVEETEATHSIEISNVAISGD